eukprot:Pgem_evm1s3678
MHISSVKAQPIFKIGKTYTLFKALMLSFFQRSASNMSFVSLSYLTDILTFRFTKSSMFGLIIFPSTRTATSSSVGVIVTSLYHLCWH